jgi:hypothetical protein
MPAWPINLTMLLASSPKIKNDKDPEKSVVMNLITSLTKKHPILFCFIMMFLRQKTLILIIFMLLALC